ncbi:Putative universal stress protein [Pirellula sp. SH-Sr6A]|uniref:universal stress protein n=1 Tax=Pirellula sp. SH-Sr6A TaxID=1632865 RepID=UPI00078B2D6A|nr:universal stress protein [Pirellula sp. SH-Sr6A]AMV31437.1 Putative universal stress protein [Pirellula sp. SH-Sr6A]
MKVLLAIDGSPSSCAAIQELYRIPLAPKSEVRVIIVDAPLDDGLFRSKSLGAYDDLIRQQRAEVMQKLQDATQLVKAHPSKVNVTSALLEGHVKETIVDEASRYGANLIVVGSHGYGPIHRFFLGSVSQYVAHNAPCSVLIVKTSKLSPD